MTINPEIEDYEVISTGTIISVHNKAIIFKIENITYELIFRDNNEFVEHKISYEIPEGTTKMRILYENFNNSFGIGNTEPLNVGILDNRTIFFNYRISSLGVGLGKLVHYTWLLSKLDGGEYGK